MRKLIHILIVAVAMLAVWSCSSSRKVMEGHDGPSPTDPASLLPVLTDKGNWNTMKIPVSISLRQPVSARIGGTMTLVRGSEIRLSLRFFGMEVAAASVTGDSVKAYVKVRKIYVAESIREILGGFPATVDNLQSLLLARLFQAGAFTPDYSRCAVEKAVGEGLMITPPSPVRSLNCSFEAQAAPALINSVRISGGREYSADVRYSYPRNPVARLPEDLSLSGQCAGRSFEVDLGYSVGSIDRSASTPPPFVIPSGYSRVSLSSLVRLLDSLK